MVLVGLSVLSFYTSLNGCFRELQNHTPVYINKNNLNQQSFSFAIFTMNDLFPNLVFIGHSKDSCTKSRQKTSKKMENICAYYHYLNFQCSFVRIHDLWVRIRAQIFRLYLVQRRPPSLPPGYPPATLLIHNIQYSYWRNTLFSGA